jgi:hypothetical protein
MPFISSHHLSNAIAQQDAQFDTAFIGTQALEGLHRNADGWRNYMDKLVCANTLRDLS